VTSHFIADKRTKIVCTIGPASQSAAVLEGLIAQGMNVARINFAHGDFDFHRATIANVRAASARAGRRVAIMGDLPGPKLRIGMLATEPIQIETGQAFVLQPGEAVGDATGASTSFAELARVVKAGDRIFLNDGFVGLEVEAVEGDAVHCRVLAGGELRSRKGMNLPGIDLGISAFTARDREILAFAAEQRLDAVSLSFVQDAADIVALRLEANGLGYAPFVVAKIERSRALDNLDEILDAADGIMVARGDLGVEIPIEEVAVAQKDIIRRANRVGKPVITATHMLESMTSSRRPTRAEATDVANAILDGTDCVMLSGETAIGQFPREAVATMAAIARSTEKARPARLMANLLEAQRLRGDLAEEDLISLTVYLAVEGLSPDVVFTPTESGSTARRLTRFRLSVPVVALSVSEKTCQDLQFSYGVEAMHVDRRPQSWAGFALDWTRRHDCTASRVLLTEGTSAQKAGGRTRIEVLHLR
jgi:pyruvate kinase